MQTYTPERGEECVHGAPSTPSSHTYTHGKITLAHCFQACVKASLMPSDSQYFFTEFTLPSPPLLLLPVA